MECIKSMQRVDEMATTGAGTGPSVTRLHLARRRVYGVIDRPSIGKVTTWPTSLTT